MREDSFHFNSVSGFILNGHPYVTYWMQKGKFVNSSLSQLMYDPNCLIVVYVMDWGGGCNLTVILKQHNTKTKR